LQAFGQGTIMHAMTAIVLPREPAPIVDAIVIGRNEGERLSACLASLQGGVRRVVYVDSGSTDGSVAAARASGAMVVMLERSAPFTAARARNAGLAVLKADPDPARFVQFVDGDCEVREGWIASALTAFAGRPAAVVVCGRRRERFPERSIWNRLCNREWNTPLGLARACGGDALMRLDAVLDIGGYRDSLIAGEEPELCLRLRGRGGEVWRIGAEMTLHDAAILRFGQWWRRQRRAGYAFAEGAALHGRRPDRHWVAETRRAMLWGIVLPVASLAAAFWHPVALALLLTYPLQVLRLLLRWRAEGVLGAEAAFFSVVGRFPEGLGAAGYWLNRLRRRQADLIEYK